MLESGGWVGGGGLRKWEVGGDGQPLPAAPTTATLFSTFCDRAEDAPRPRIASASPSFSRHHPLRPFPTSPPALSRPVSSLLFPPPSLPSPSCLLPSPLHPFPPRPVFSLPPSLPSLPPPSFSPAPSAPRPRLSVLTAPFLSSRLPPPPPFVCRSTVRGVHVSALGPLGRAWESGSVQVAQDVSGLPSEVHPLCTLRAARCWNASIAEVVYIPVHDADGSAWRRAGGGDGPACGVLAVIELFLRPGGDGTALPAAISAAHHALDAAGLSMSPVEEDQVVAIGDVADPEPARAAAAAAGGAAAPAPAPTPVPASSAASASVATAADSGDSDANDASSARIEPRASAFASSSSSRAVSEPRACRGPRSVRFEQDRDGASSGSPHTPLSTTGDAHLEFLEFRSGAAVDAFEDGAAACRADDPCEGLARAGGLGGRSRSVGARVSPPVSPESPQPFDRIAADGQGAKLAPRRAGGLVRTRSAHALRVDLDD